MNTFPLTRMVSIIVRRLTGITTEWNVERIKKWNGYVRELCEHQAQGITRQKEEKHRLSLKRMIATGIEEYPGDFVKELVNVLVEKQCIVSQSLFDELFNLAKSLGKIEQQYLLLVECNLNGVLLTDYSELYVKQHCDASIEPTELKRLLELLNKLIKLKLSLNVETMNLIFSSSLRASGMSLHAPVLILNCMTEMGVLPDAKNWHRFESRLISSNAFSSISTTDELKIFSVALITGFSSILNNRRFRDLIVIKIDFARICAAIISQCETFKSEETAFLILTTIFRLFDDKFSAAVLEVAIPFLVRKFDNLDACVQFASNLGVTDRILNAFINGCVLRSDVKKFILIWRYIVQKKLLPTKFCYAAFVKLLPRLEDAEFEQCTTLLKQSHALAQYRDVLIPYYIFTDISTHLAEKKDWWAILDYLKWFKEEGVVIKHGVFVPIFKNLIGSGNEGDHFFNILQSVADLGFRPLAIVSLVVQSQLQDIDFFSSFSVQQNKLKSLLFKMKSLEIRHMDEPDIHLFLKTLISIKMTIETAGNSLMDTPVVASVICAELAKLIDFRNMPLL